ncbi:Bro-N domain-containing protein [Paracoccus sp. Z118]|uniref:BRO-N domain-containing protein n=1 Tax=Paracoccus sp. Z118 TaxID=2851017 RepID=UPI001C2CA5EE|nr:Bro-N domain-containing protein [Paracoccus sp. Z118]MBV0893462.1 Bro-N domain-containing protein [Paracoccus sp. Z118]
MSAALNPGLDKTETNTIRLTDGNQRGNLIRSIISESGLYRLVLRADKAEAKPFKDWVTKVVLPAILRRQALRKDGALWCCSGRYGGWPSEALAGTLGRLVLLVGKKPRSRESRWTPVSL